MKRSICLSLLLLAICGMVRSQAIDKVVAVVGDNIILHSEIQAQFEQMKNQMQDSTLDPQTTKCNIFEGLLLERLFLAQAQIDSVAASPEEVDAEIDRRIKYFISVFGSKEKFEEYNGKTVMEFKDEVRDDIEKQLIADKMRAKVFAGLKISPAEVKDFFEKIPADSVPYFNSELEMGELVMFPKVGDEEKKRAKKKLEDIRNEILKGSDFSVKAIQYSEDPGSYLDGGSLGTVGRGEMVPEFEAVIFRLKEGEVSEVFETPFGYHISIVDEKRGDKVKVRHILIRAKPTFRDQNSVKETMDSILHQLRVDSLSWRDAVRQYSQDEQSKSIGGMMTNPKNGTTYFEKADIDGTLIFTIDRMKVGDYSDVLTHTANDKTGEVKQGYRIIWLKSETQPHKASLDQDYAKIQAAAKAEKQHKMLEKWLEMHIGKNFVRIEDMKYCPQMERWTKSN